MLDEYDLDLSFKTRHRVGGDLVRYPVCFSQDELSFFCSTGSSVKIFNTQTGALLGVLKGHTARVTGVFVNPLNELQVYTTSHDGTIRRWDTNECVCLQVYEIGIPILRGSMASEQYMYIALNPNHYTSLDTSNQSEKGGNGSDMKEKGNPQQTQGNRKLVPSSSSSSSSQQHSTALMHSSKSYQPFSICSFYLGDTPTGGSDASKPHGSSSTSFSSQTKNTTMGDVDGGHDDQQQLQTLFTMTSFTDLSRSQSRELICAIGENELHVYSKTTRNHGIIYHGRKITCVGVHPKQDVVAIGDASGRITLYVNLSATAGSSIEGSVSTVFRWHSAAVSSIAFSPDGTYLLSGGTEAVLVFWNLATGQNHFLPRLGHVLQHISTSTRGGLYAVCCANNSVILVSAITSQKKNSVYGCDLISSTNKLQMVQYSNKDYIALIGQDGNLQIFDCEKDAHITSIDINNQNYLQERRNPILNHAIMSQNGTWTITTHSGVQNATGPSLRFWYRSPSVKSSTGRDSSYYLQVDDAPKSKRRGKASVDDDTPEPPTAVPEKDAYGNSLRTPFDTATNDATDDTSTALASSSSMDDVMAYTPVPFTPKASTKSSINFKDPLLLRTVWHEPENYEILSVAYDEVNTAVLTGHADGKVRVWKIQSKQWIISHTFDFHGKLPFSIVFSPDYSIVSIGFGNTLTLWKIEQHTLNLTFLFSYSLPGQQTVITTACFLQTVPLLYIATHHGIYIFDLLTLQCSSSYACTLAGMVAHPLLPLVFAVAVLPYKKTDNSSHVLAKPTRECNVLLFQNGQTAPTIIGTIEDVLLAKEKGSDNQNVYLRSAYETSITLTPNFFVYLNRSREIGIIPYTNIGTQILQRQSMQYVQPTIIQHVYHQSLASIYQIEKDAKHVQNHLASGSGGLPDQGSTTMTTTGTLAENKTAIHRVCTHLSNIPSHTLPSLSLVFGQFMNAFAPPPL